MTNDDPTSPPRPKPRLWRRRVIVVGVGGLVLLATASAGAAGGWTLANSTVLATRPNPEPTEVRVPTYTGADDVTMPDVRGLESSEARQVIADAGVPASLITTVERPAASASGTIVGQKPAFGTVSPSAVELVVSTGATVPDVVGEDATAASNTLDELGTRVERQSGYDPDQKTGVVLSTSPKAGADLLDSVLLTVNEAPSGRYLATLDPVDGGCSTNGQLIVDGTTYKEGLVCSSGSTAEPRETAWLLQKAVDRVTGTIGVEDSSEPGTSVHVVVLADRAVLFDKVVRYGAPAELDVRTTGALRLTVRAWAGQTSDYSTPSAALGDLQLLGSTTAMSRLPEE